MPRFKNDAPKFNFIDLFSGLGGFHQAMYSLHGKCVLASEINEACRQTYLKNFPRTPIVGDIKQVNPCVSEGCAVLCAGFPCQPFSKAGLQEGFNDQDKGNLFFDVLSFIRSNPEIKFLVMENVRNLADKDDNWHIITSSLKELGFCITEDPLILSPHQFGIPQIRERVYILGIREDIVDYSKVPEGKITKESLQISSYYRKCDEYAAYSILDDNVDDSYQVSDELRTVLDAWECFRVKLNVKRYGAPVWICAFGYGIDDDEVFKQNVGYYDMPPWKQRFYDYNRQFYNKNREFIDEWLC